MTQEFLSSCNFSVSRIGMTSFSMSISSVCHVQPRAALKISQSLQKQEEGDLGAEDPDGSLCPTIRWERTDKKPSLVVPQECCLQYPPLVHFFHCNLSAPSPPRNPLASEKASPQPSDYTWTAQEMQAAQQLCHGHPTLDYDKKKHSSFLGLN